MELWKNIITKMSFATSPCSNITTIREWKRLPSVLHFAETLLYGCSPSPTITGNNFAGNLEFCATTIQQDIWYTQQRKQVNMRQQEVMAWLPKQSKCSPLVHKIRLASFSKRTSHNFRGSHRKVIKIRGLKEVSMKILQYFLAKKGKKLFLILSTLLS